MKTPTVWLVNMTYWYSLESIDFFLKSFVPGSRRDSDLHKFWLVVEPPIPKIWLIYG